MPDSPDYSKYLPGSVRFSLQDMSELAVRLGSPDVFDRRGEVVWLDTFDNGLSGWEQYLSGTGAAITVIADHVYRYPYQALLTSGTTVNMYAQIEKRVTGLVSGKIGLEVSFTYNIYGTYYNFFINIFTGAVVYQCHLRLDPNTKNWQVMDNNANWHTVLTKTVIVGGAWVFSPIKIVCDPTTGKYVRLLIADDSVDLSAYSMFVNTAVQAALFDIQIENVGVASYTCDMVFGHVIVTGNEP